MERCLTFCWLVGSSCIFDATAYVLRLVHIPSLPPPCHLLFVNPVKIPVLLGTRESGTREQINQSAVERPANHWRLKCLARGQKGALAFDFVLLALRASSAGCVGNLRQVLVPPLYAMSSMTRNPLLPFSFVCRCSRFSLLAFPPCVWRSGTGAAVEIVANPGEPSPSGGSAAHPAPMTEQNQMRWAHLRPH